MWPRTVQLLALLGWSLTILSWVRSREPAAPTPGPIWLDGPSEEPTDPRLRAPVDLALETLRGADRIFVNAVTADPNQALYGLAWQMLARHPRADSLFAELFYHGSHPAQLYALAGLQLSRSEHYDYLSRAFGQFRVPIRVVRGCRVGAEQPGVLVAELRRGHWAADFDRWSADAVHRAGRLASAAAIP